MKINIKDIREDGIDIEFVEGQKELNLQHKQLKTLKEAKANIHLQKEDIGYWASGVIDIFWDLICSRCLTSFPNKAEIKFSREYKAGKAKAEKDKILEGTELNTVFFNGDEIDLGEDIRQDILLNIPIKTLCKAECLGICSRCGQDLNYSKCNCEQKNIDVRWEALKSIKKKLEKKN